MITWAQFAHGMADVTCLCRCAAFLQHCSTLTHHWPLTRSLCSSFNLPEIGTTSITNATENLTTFMIHYEKCKTDECKTHILDQSTKMAWRPKGRWPAGCMVSKIEDAMPQNRHTALRTDVWSSKCPNWQMVKSFWEVCYEIGSHQVPGVFSALANQAKRRSYSYTPWTENVGTTAQHEELQRMPLHRQNVAQREDRSDTTFGIRMRANIFYWVTSNQSNQS